ncbi:MAG: hypothetical protein WDW38_011536 [Sanguina aurantia]
MIKNAERNLNLPARTDETSRGPAQRRHTTRITRSNRCLQPPPQTFTRGPKQLSSHTSPPPCLFQTSHTHKTSRGPAQRLYKTSDGTQHLGSALSTLENIPARSFPGPPPSSGQPLRVLPIGGLGEIGMNCMLVGVYDRYILIDAGLMFPDFQDLGMQKILPDTSFLHQWKDKIEAVVITHGHEDHIGALPWVLPALDPNTPVYAASFVMKLIQKRLNEYSLFDEQRFKTIEMRTPFTAGPFQVEPVRVTHSIPDCCGLILRSDHGTIVHTGDWKIDETPTDGQSFDREMFEALGREPVALMMSDSTNVLSPGRTQSEATVQDSMMQKVLAHKGKGRVIVTQFASNLHRLYSVKKAADASGRKICFVGASLNHYLEAAWKDGRAPFDPKELLDPNYLSSTNPNDVLIVTTGSQAEPKAQLSLAARESSQKLKIKTQDLILYSAKVIPGNEGRVTKMLNSLAMQGARVVAGRADNLHVSGHAYQDELMEVLRYVKPQHFLPVHGEFSFLCEHARLARETAGVQYTQVIKNGQMLGIHERPNGKNVSSGSMASLVGEVDLINFYNDGGMGTGTSKEMCIDERTTLAFDGVVVLAIDVVRTAALSDIDGATLRCRHRITTRGMWTDNGKLVAGLHRVAEEAVCSLAHDSALAMVERMVIKAVLKECNTFNQKKPEVICIAHEYDPRAGADQSRSSSRPSGPPGSSPSSYNRPYTSNPNRANMFINPQAPPQDNYSPSSSDSGGSSSSGAQSNSEQQQQQPYGESSVSGSAPESGAQEPGRARMSPGRLQVLPKSVMDRRRAANPREAPGPGLGDVAGNSANSDYQ